MSKAVKCSIIVLAAGEAKRMNGVKIRHKIDGEKSMLEKVLNIFKTINSDDSIELERILVTNECHERFVREMAEEWQIVVNKVYKSGMSTSIAAGVKRAIEKDSEAVLLMLADMPFVDCEEVKRVIALFKESLKCENSHDMQIIRPFHKNIPGFPVLFGSGHYDALLRLKGDTGAREVIKENVSHLVKIESDDESCVIDIDTTEIVEKTKKRK
jgi:molybdenum cofactor cytidylyltransferase